jgi:hypothetical protein
LKVVRSVLAAGAMALAIGQSSASHATEVLLQVKSFIKAVDLRDPKQFDPGSKTCQAAMAAIVNCGTIGGEDPKSGSRADGEYRLWSELKAQVTCTGNKVVKWDVAPVTFNVGREFGFVSTMGEIDPGLTGTPALKGASAVDRVNVRYRMRGQPNGAANQLMNNVKPRSCTFIWHTVDASLACKNGTPEVVGSLRASGFPSHRLWVDGRLAKEVPQGPFNNLWTCDVLDSTLVQ